MKASKLTVNLIVNNIEEVISFYNTVLGFEVIMTLEDNGKIHWALIKAGKAEIIFQQKDYLLKQFPDLDISKNATSSSTIVLINIGEIQDIYDSIIKKIKPLSVIKANFNGTKEFAIQDIAGNILLFSNAK